MCYTKYIKNVCSNVFSNNGKPFLNHSLCYKNFLICNNNTQKYCISVNKDISLLKNTSFFMDYRLGQWKIERPNNMSHRAVLFLEEMLKKELENITNPNILTKFKIPSDTISLLYEQCCVDYIQLKNYGLYHTGRNVAELKVPLFECNQELVLTPYKENKNIRLLMSIKIKNNSDLIKSKYSLDISDHYALPPHLYLGLK